MKSPLFPWPPFSRARHHFLSSSPIITNSSRSQHLGNCGWQSWRGQVVCQQFGSRSLITLCFYQLMNTIRHCSWEELKCAPLTNSSSRESSTDGCGPNPEGMLNWGKNSGATPAAAECPSLSPWKMRRDLPEKCLPGEREREREGEREPYFSTMVTQWVRKCGAGPLLSFQEVTHCDALPDSR